MDIKKVKKPTVINIVKEGNSVGYRVEQLYKIEDITVNFRYNFFAFNKGLVANNDFDINSFEPLNKEVEKDLEDYFGDKGKAFEAMELMKMDLDFQPEIVLNNK